MRCHENVAPLLVGMQVNVTSLDDVTVVVVGCTETPIIKMFMHA